MTPRGPDVALGPTGLSSTSATSRNPAFRWLSERSVNLEAMPRLALFDLDDTLISSKDAFIAWIDEVVAAHGVGGDARGFLEKEHVFWTGSPDDTFRGLVEYFGLPADPAELMHAYRGRMVELLEPYPGVTDGLEALRDAGWRIGIVTNGFGDFQNAKIDAADLRAYVDVVCISDVEGAWKPEPKIFELASDRAGAPLEGGWMVGDSLAADIAGGIGAGLHTAWLHHGRPLPSAAAGDPQPEHIIEHTADAFELILGRP